MEERVVNLVTQGGDVAFIIVLVIGLAFWIVLKFKEFEKRMETIERRLDDGDSRFHDQDKTIATMASDVAFIRGLLEGKEGKAKEKVQ